MSSPKPPLICHPERHTQYKVLQCLQKLGYTYLGDLRCDTLRNARSSPIEQERLTTWLRGRGLYTEEEIRKAIAKAEACVSSARSDLLSAHRTMYSYLYYGVELQLTAGEDTRRVRFIDWEHPDTNEYTVAEEVSMRSAAHTRRPDVVLYINGIAFAVIELKKSNEQVAEGIRQNLTNQRREEIPYFFTTIQLVMAGTESEGLRYGVVGTPEKYFLSWKRDPQDTANGHLFEHLAALCDTHTLLELAHDFMLWHQGIKKVARHNQYHGIKAAQQFITRREGGIIWHTQGSGKSLMMVWLAKWILRSNPDARVFIITDRVELDEQMEDNFRQVGMQEVYRTTDGGDLITQLNNKTYPIVCTLIQKFRGIGQESAPEDVEDLLQQMRRARPADFSVKGDLHVFVDECHRSESGKLKQAMDTLLGKGLYYGFTGTPILKADKSNTLAIFGNFIHRYKFDEAVRDGVVLDLLYEARYIKQRVTDKKLMDEIFARITRGKSEHAVTRIKATWGTVQALHSVEDRIKAISRDIWTDFLTKPRLIDFSGTAILVASSVYNAFRYYEALNKTGPELRGHCAVISSFAPTPAVIRTEGAILTEARYKYDTSLRMLKDFSACSGVAENATSATEDHVRRFETRVKEMFLHEPGNMRLLIVVDKLLTGFDAPSATYLYIDKPMQGHGLFQAVCRVNRLDGDTKDYGHIIDYRHLFQDLEDAYELYAGQQTSACGNAFSAYDKEDIDGLLRDKNRLLAHRIITLTERLHQLCDNVAQPKGAQEYCDFFCHGEIDVCKQRRKQLYTLVPALVRSFAHIKTDMAAIRQANGAPFFTAEQCGDTQHPGSIEQWVKHYSDVYDWIELYMNDRPDRKAIGAEMRSLLDAYVGVNQSEILSTLGDKSLVRLMAEQPANTTQELLHRVRDTKTAAEIIINNLRQEITDRHAENPKYYDSLSRILDTLAQQMHQDAMQYAEYLQRLQSMAAQIQAGHTTENITLPAYINTARRKALYQNAPGEWSPDTVQHFVEQMEHNWVRYYVAEDSPDSMNNRRFHNAILNDLDDMAPTMPEEEKEALARLVFEMACKQ